MATTAFNALYRQEFISAFAQRESLTRKTVTTEAQVNGSTCIFLVAGNSSDTAVTRGTNGLIPAVANSYTTKTATLVEWHDLRRETRFNIELGQGDHRRVMQMESMAVINRKIDDDIITELNTATQDTGAAATADLSMVMYGIAILGNSFVPMDGNISALISPAFYAYLMQTKEFASADFVSNKPFTSGSRMFTWAGVNFIVHNNLPGAGTNAEKCFLYHKNAIGHACDTANIGVKAGYDEEQDYSWARTSAFMGSKILQNSGIVVLNHDGSAYAAQ